MNYRAKLSVLILLAIASSGKVSSKQVGGWFKQSPPMGEYAITSVDFSGRDSGMAVALGADGGVLRTTDGGSSWSFIDSRNYFPLRPFYLTEVKHLVGNKWVIANQVGEFGISTDFGQSWYVSNCIETGTNALTQINDTTIYSVGSFSSVAFMSKSGNGGVGWTCDTLDQTVTPLGVDFTSTSDGFIVGWGETQSGGRLLGTTDGGVTWLLDTLFSASRFWDIGFASISRGVIVGSSPTPVYLTVDGGTSWFPLESINDVSLRCISWDPSGVGMLAGANGVVFRSSDYGATWSRQFVGVAVQINDIVVIDSATACAVGFDKTIFRTNSANVVAVEEKKPAIEQMYVVDHYMSPNTNELSIDLQVNASILLESVMYDVVGAMLPISIVRCQNGEYATLILNYGNVASGIYYVGLSSIHGAISIPLFISR